MMMNKRIFLKVTLLISLMTQVSVTAQISGRADGMRFLPNVVEQFVALTFQFADPLGFHMDGTPDPRHCKHYQGLARVGGPDGTPFFLVTKSGNSPDDPGVGEACDAVDGPETNGHLIVFRMGSRDKNGERLRSNRLQRDAYVDDSLPPPEDKATVYYSFVGGDPNDPDPNRRPGVRFRDGEGLRLDRVYRHPGGMQLVGNILAVALEHPVPYPTLFCDQDPENEICDPDRYADDPTLIMFFDVSDPEAPIFKSQFALIHPEDGQPFRKAGVVAITPLPNGLYLMATTGGNGNEVHFFRSTIGDLSSPDLSWVFVDKVAPEVDDDAQQTLQFIREDNIHGDLYLAGVRGHAAFGSDHDKVDLYLVHGQTENFELDETISQTMIRRGRLIRTFPFTAGTRLANGAAASGFHISPSGELILYITEHDNDGPGGTVKAGEWAHRNVVRAGSPTLFPTALVNGPYEVDEGRATSLSGTAGPPITKAWIKFFGNPNLDDSDAGSFGPVIDYADFNLDDFDNFFKLGLYSDPPPNVQLHFHSDSASSLRWFAPQGCSIKAIDYGDTDEDLPETLTMVGDGVVHEFPNLALIHSDGTTSDINDEIDAVDFLAGCDDYYNAPVTLFWDLDLDGSFEATGSPVTFSALAFDGPSTVNVPAQAVHSLGGEPGQSTAVVNVRNVAPELSQFRITDGAGNQLNVDVPFALTGLPLTVSSGFTDPGVLDHQTATINWGDGTVKPQSIFTSFDEAFGDGTGAASDVHSFSTGGTFAIALTVTDDDNGTDNESATARVLTPEQALVEMIAMLDAALAACPNSAVCFDLGRARVALAGSRPESVNGALNMIRAGDRPSAAAFLNTAGTWLERAETDGGTGLDTLQALVAQVAAALSL